jgi:alpha/beta superfamily hydrolase
MNRTLFFTGLAGKVELLLDEPAASPRGLVLVAHPQPLLGGSATHKVPQFVARGLQERGWLVARPNFRGVAASEGAHDHGKGETEDLVAVASQLRDLHPGLPLGLFGFSFGAFVQSRVAHHLAEARQPCFAAVLAGLPVGEVEGKRHYKPAGPVPRTLIVHGEQDDLVILSDVLAWAGTHGHGVMVVPGADHFFSGRLALLRSLVVDHFEYAARADASS